MSRKAGYFSPTRIHRMNRMLSLIWEGPLTCVWRIIDRKSGRRPRGRSVLLNISGCIRGVSCDCAEVIRLEGADSKGLSPLL